MAEEKQSTQKDQNQPSGQEHKDEAKAEQKKFISVLNKCLYPFEYSYQAMRTLGKQLEETTPLVYNEVEGFVKRNLIPIERKNKMFDKKDLADISDKITSTIIRQIPNMNEGELRTIVKHRKAQSFIDVVTKSLNVVGRKEYTTLPKGKKFDRVLIANRGEIALRIIRACRELGIETVLVYTEPDKNTLAVKYADLAYNIGDKLNYLDYKKIVAVAKKAQASAIHPGYGFLAENAHFAKLCEKEKIKFIGPSAKAITLLGDKVKAKKTSMKVGVPIVAGRQKPLNDKKEALKLAKEIGFPIILKAAAGGGGKGMRVVRSEQEIDDAFKSAQAEAIMAFKDDSLYLEKYIEEPRHIEFQILADQYGNVIHLGERDCSIQRKHQKLIEEAPSPALDEHLREKMGAAAVKICRVAKYEGAGTVEFLLDKNKNFYFIEVNTRIQVEHGVTEMITGIDLVKEQIKIASGAQLKYTQDNIKISSWAIECRINAEDPLAGFTPSSGIIRNYMPPGGPGIRVNSNGYSGYRVEPHYDSLISLLICYGKTRREAIVRMRRALREYTIDGVETTIPFHLAVFHNKRFVQGAVNTSFIEQEHIMQKVKKYYFEKKKDLTSENKIILVSTAVAKYREKRNWSAHKPTSWVMAGRYEQLDQREM